MGSRAIWATPIVVFLCWIAMALGVQEAYATSPQVQMGVIDVAQWDFSAQSIPLAGDWEFYYGQWIDPDVFAEGIEPAGKTYVSVPGSWRSGQDGSGDRLPKYGYGTYRLKVRVAAEQNPLALSLVAVRSAHKTWVNGDLLASSGTIGTSRATAQPGSAFDVVVVPLSNRESGNDFDIVIHVANFHFREGGIPWVPVIGLVDRVFRDGQKELGLEVFFVASLLIIGLYHLAAWALHKQGKHGLYFALFCLIIVPRTAIIGHLAFFPVENLSWEWQRKLEYLGIFAGLPLFLLFMDALYPGYFGRRTVRAVVAISAAFCGAVLAFPTWVHSELLLYFELFCGLTFAYMTVRMGRVVANREANSRFVGTMMIIVFGTAIHDMLFFWRFFESRPLFPAAIYGMVLAQSVILAKQFAKDFQRQKALAKENADLLRTVKGQMDELRQSRRLMMERDEETRRHVTDVLHGTVQSRLVSARHYLQKALQYVSGQSAADTDTANTDPADTHPPEMADGNGRSIGVHKNAMSSQEMLQTLIGKAGEELERVSQQDVRGIGKMLHPLTIDLGLCAALEELADRFGEHVHIQVQVSDAFKAFETANVEIVARAPMNTPGAKSVRRLYLAAYRIVEEALTNVIKHAGAHHVCIEVDVKSDTSGQTVWIAVKDDGKGIEEAFSPGIGWHMIEARLENLEGWWQRYPSDAGGTVVEVGIPVIDLTDDELSRSYEAVSEFNDPLASGTA